MDSICGSQNCRLQRWVAKKMGYQSSNDQKFLETVARWINETGEILVMIRFSHAGGNRSYEFFRSFQCFRERVLRCEPRTCILVFRKPQLPLRGIVDNSLITSALAMVSDGQEYLIAGLKEVHHGKASWLENWSGDTHQDMKEDLTDAEGTEIAFGPYPPWLEDNEDLISAVVPMPNGEVVCGVY
jgi:hypothetical protein